MALVMFRVYPSQLIHLGKQDPDQAPTDWFYVSLCGRKLIGQMVEKREEYEPVCQTCRGVFDHAKEVFRELEERFL